MERTDRPSASTLAALVSEIQGVLGDDLVGLYLYGSAVTGGFDAAVSDLDLVAVTAHEIDEIDLSGLERMHDRFADQNPGWRSRIEVVYIGRATLASFRTSDGPLAVISPGEPFHVRDDRAAAWLQNWYLVREIGKTFHGPPPTEVVPRIEWAEFVAATRRYASEVQSRNGPGTLAYTILTLCRALYAVRMQSHGSKQEAAAWAREQMPEWAWLIDAALACRLTGGRVGFEDERSRTAAETFIALVSRTI
jgi:hypothetical protein